MRAIRAIFLFSALLWTTFACAGPANEGRPGPICGPILSLFGVHFYGRRRGFGSHYPSYRSPAKQVPDIWIMSASNDAGLDPNKLLKVPLIRQQMVDGTFDYAKTENIISGGYHETTETFLLSEGHHRILAALQVAAETGNWEPFKQLINHGSWANIDQPAHSVGIKPLPVQPFAVDRKRQKEMDRILSGMQVPSALRIFWNTEWMR